MSDLVSIILPVYNQANYLPAALDGVMTQTYYPYELIVVDDGSTDDTAKILVDYQSRFPFLVLSQKNQGLPNALNTGFAASKGTYLTWTSADNIMLPDMLTVLVNELVRLPKIGLVYADRYVIDEQGKNLGLFDVPDYDPYLLLHVNLVNCCFLYRRSCMVTVGKYDPDFIYGEDWEYWIRISKYFKMKKVQSPQYLYRIHPKSMTGEIVSGSANRMSYDEFARRIRKRMPLRWIWGKLKYWWIKYTQPNHALMMNREKWHHVLEQYARDDMVR